MPGRSSTTRLSVTFHSVPSPENAFASPAISSGIEGSFAFPALSSFRSSPPPEVRKVSGLRSLPHRMSAERVHDPHPSRIGRSMAIFAPYLVTESNRLSGPSTQIW